MSLKKSKFYYSLDGSVSQFIESTFAWYRFYLSFYLREIQSKENQPDSEIDNCGWIFQNKEKLIEIANFCWSYFRKIPSMSCNQSQVYFRILFQIIGMSTFSSLVLFIGLSNTNYSEHFEHLMAAHFPAIVSHYSTNLEFVF